MTSGQLLESLKTGKTAALSRKQWQAVACDFVETESHDTGIAGPLRLGRFGKQLVAVEQADDNLIAVRPLASGKAGASFIEQRMAAYDRLWDG